MGSLEVSRHPQRPGHAQLLQAARRVRRDGPRADAVPGVQRLLGRPFGDGWTTGLNNSQNGNAGIFLAAAKGQDALKPERNKELEFGVDLAFFDSKVDLGVTMYDAKSTDVILSLPVPPSTGYFSQVQNAAEMTNKGIEISAQLARRHDALGGVDDRRAVREEQEQGHGPPRLPTSSFSAARSTAASRKATPTASSSTGTSRAAATRHESTCVDGFDVNAFCTANNAPDGAMYIGDDGFPIFDPDTARRW